MWFVGGIRLSDGLIKEIEPIDDDDKIPYNELEDTDIHGTLSVYPTKK